MDILVLLKLCVLKDPHVQSKRVADELFVRPSEITQSIKRCKTSGLILRSSPEKEVNQSGLLEFLIHGFRFVFPAQRGGLIRGVPTGIGAPPLKAQFQDMGDPPPVWPDKDGKIRGFSFLPLHRQVPKAALLDPQLYELLALVDALRGERVRERQLAKEELTKRLDR
ncbi:MAG TPA: hypothetical protein VHZ52_16855 [Acidobacteriaceae bacterium]|nr:hypothetical protein [Acidobacteriaceae bacterium]